MYGAAYVANTTPGYFREVIFFITSVPSQLLKGSLYILRDSGY